MQVAASAVGVYCAGRSGCAIYGRAFAPALDVHAAIFSVLSIYVLLFCTSTEKWRLLLS
jgi:hypothetical protein